MLERVLYCIVLVALAFFLVYWLGRFFSNGVMDGINHKLNQFTKLKKDDNKEEKK